MHRLHLRIAHSGRCVHFVGRRLRVNGVVALFTALDRDDGRNTVNAVLIFNVSKLWQAHVGQRLVAGYIGGVLVHQLSLIVVNTGLYYSVHAHYSQVQSESADGGVIALASGTNEQDLTRGQPATINPCQIPTTK